MKKPKLEAVTVTAFFEDPDAEKACREIFERFGEFINAEMTLDENFAETSLREITYLVPLDKVGQCMRTLKDAGFRSAITEESTENGKIST